MNINQSHSTLLLPQTSSLFVAEFFAFLLLDERAAPDGSGQKLFFSVIVANAEHVGSVNWRKVEAFAARQHGLWFIHRPTPLSLLRN
jgi:hypothetical protein